MNDYTPHIKIALVISLCISFFMGLSAQTIDFTFDTKDYNGQVLPLNQRLDPEKNHLVLFSAFWCLPCVKQLDDVLSKNIDVYRDLYNLEVIILNDDYFENTNIALNKIRDKQWYFQQYMTDNIFGDLGVNSIPRDYLILAGDITGERVYASSFLNTLEANYLESGYDSPFFSENIQLVSASNCADISEHYYGVTNTDMFLEKEYYNIEGQYYRSGVLNKNIYRFDPLAESEVLVFDYYLDQCDIFTLKDQQGDAIQISIESRRIENGEIIIETDQVIQNDCGEYIPFVMSSIYGSNAGLVFDIENNEIVSRLICHTKDEESIYLDEKLADLCGSVNTEEQISKNKTYLTNNPGNGLFEIINGQNMIIRILDVNGREVLFQEGDNRIDISDLPTGLYFVGVGPKNRIYIKQ